jgi:hypothetical protein
MNLVGIDHDHVVKLPIDFIDAAFIDASAAKEMNVITGGLDPLMGWNSLFHLHRIDFGLMGLVRSVHSPEPFRLSQAITSEKMNRRERPSLMQGIPWC